MANRHTMNFSIPPAQEKFVHEQVDSGRYRSASEVVREGLRLLEEREHARLLEKWLYDSISPEEKEQLPPKVMEHARGYIRHLVDEGIRDRDAGRVSEGAKAMNRIGERLRARSKSA